MPQINLSEIANGALAERFEIELNKVLANIADPNTDAKKARAVSITVTMKADENRDVVLVDIATKATLAPAKSVGTKIVIDRDGRGNVIGAELKSPSKDQTYFDDAGTVHDDRGNVVKMLYSK